MKRNGASLLALATAMSLGATALSAPQPPSLHLREARLSHLLGMTVQDPNAQELGTVKDFVLDSASAELEYALIGSGGVLGLGSRTQALPVSNLSAATIVRGILSTGVTRQQWLRMARFKGNLAALPDLEPPGSSAPNRSNDSALNRRPELASQLLGATVVNRAHQTLGTVFDLFIDLSRQKPAFVLLRPTGALARGHSFAIPLSLLTRVEGDRLLLDASPQLLQQAPLLTQQAWNDAANGAATTIYRISSTET